MRFKGIIALDVDGTLTCAKHELELPVQDYINNLIDEGWLLIFMTGRTFSFAYPLLTGLRKNYYFAPQNGAALYRMPEEEYVLKRYLPISTLKTLIRIFQEHEVGLLVEAGREYEDICYYNPNDFSSRELEYLLFRANISMSRWHPLKTFEALPIAEFAVAKYFASKEKSYALAQDLEKADFNVVVIRDPFRQGFYMALVNARGASKGHTLASFIKMNSQDLPVIAAGDDYNDIEMLDNSTIRIVMQTAPAEMHQFADVLAPPAENLGIIKGLEQGIWKALSK